MLQDISALKPGVFANPLFGNSPLWSLSYEWWFYMLFFLHFYFYQKHFKENIFLFNLLAFLVTLIGLLSYKFIYNQISLIAMYYYIWFSGAIVLILLNNRQLTKSYIQMIALSYLSIIVGYFFLFIYHQQSDGIGVHPILELRHYTVAFLGLFAALFFSKYLHHYCIKKTIYNKLVQLLSHVAPISFGIYILHYPVKTYFMQYTHKPLFAHCMYINYDSFIKLFSRSQNLWVY
jgi:peptidoglycan/LPS O-acetylase OafA/YrhL